MKYLKTASWLFKQLEPHLLLNMTLRGYIEKNIVKSCNKIVCFGQILEFKISQNSDVME
jgi:hypothetical protein